MYDCWREGGASLEEEPLRCGSSTVGRVVVDQARVVLETPLRFPAVGHNLTPNLDCLLSERVASSGTGWKLTWPCPFRVYTISISMSELRKRWMSGEPSPDVSLCCLAALRRWDGRWHRAALGEYQVNPAWTSAAGLFSSRGVGWSVVFAGRV